MNNRSSQIIGVGKSFLRTGISFPANENAFSLLNSEKLSKTISQKTSAFLPRPASGVPDLKNQFMNMGAAFKHGLDDQVVGMKQMARHPLDTIAKTSKGLVLLADAFTTSQGRAALQQGISSGMKYYSTHWGEGIGSLTAFVAPFLIPLGGSAVTGAGAGLYLTRGAKAAEIGEEAAALTNEAATLSRASRIGAVAKTIAREGRGVFEDGIGGIGRAPAKVQQGYRDLTSFFQDLGARNVLGGRNGLEFAFDDGVNDATHLVQTAEKTPANLTMLKAHELKWQIETGAGYFRKFFSGGAYVPKEMPRFASSELNLWERIQNKIRPLIRKEKFGPGNLSSRQVRTIEEFRDALRTAAAESPEDLFAEKLSFSDTKELKALHDDYMRLGGETRPRAQDAGARYADKVQEFRDLETLRRDIGIESKTSPVNSYTFGDLRELHKLSADFWASIATDESRAAEIQHSLAHLRHQIDDLRAAGHTYEISELEKLREQMAGVLWLGPRNNADRLDYSHLARLKQLFDYSESAFKAGRQEFGLRVGSHYIDELALIKNNADFASLPTKRFGIDRIVELENFRETLAPPSGRKFFENFTLDDLNELNVLQTRGASDDYNHILPVIMRLRGADRAGAIDYKLESLRETINHISNDAGITALNADHLSHEELTELQQLYEKWNAADVADDAAIEAGAADARLGSAFDVASNRFNERAAELSTKSQGRAAEKKFYDEVVYRTIGRFDKENAARFRPDDLSYLDKLRREVISKEIAVENADMPVASAILDDYHQAVAKLNNQYRGVKTARETGFAGSAEDIIALEDFRRSLPGMKSIGVSSAEQFTLDDLAHVSARKAEWDKLHLSAWEGASDQEAMAAISEAGSRLQEHAQIIERVRKAGFIGSTEELLRAQGLS